MTHTRQTLTYLYKLFLRWIHRLHASTMKLGVLHSPDLLQFLGAICGVLQFFEETSFKLRTPNLQEVRTLLLPRLTQSTPRIPQDLVQASTLGHTLNFDNSPISAPWIPTRTLLLSNSRASKALRLTSIEVLLISTFNLRSPQSSQLIDPCTASEHLIPGDIFLHLQRFLNVPAPNMKGLEIKTESSVSSDGGFRVPCLVLAAGLEAGYLSDPGFERTKGKCLTLKW